MYTVSVYFLLKDKVHDNESVLKESLHVMPSLVV